MFGTILKRYRLESWASCNIIVGANVCDFETQTERRDENTNGAVKQNNIQSEQ